MSAISESATLAVDAKAKALKAAGRPVIGFGAGEPDFPTPDYIVEAAQRACAQPRFHKYTPAAGLPELREAIAAKTARDSGYQVEPSQVLVTNGGKQAVYQTFATLLDPGDEVIAARPVLDHLPRGDRAGRRRDASRCRPTSAPATWPRCEDLEAARTERTKIVLFVSPSNPTGAVYPPEQVAAIGEWAADQRPVGGHRRDLRAPGLRRRGVLLDPGPGAARSPTRCVVLNGVAKTYAMTGWRVGWMIGPKDVISAAANMQSHATSNVCNVAQAAALAAVSGDLSAVAAMRRRSTGAGRRWPGC